MKTYVALLLSVK